ncbi:MULTISPECIES: NAD-dependent epimerase/dehydratase family protein [Oxalobacteraceae]|uniref:NAD-dependent epimerase/dehydratase family protein n=1 Tax=Herminiimonas sp. Marseille-P9896 TaxID=2742211 RepID=UPI001588D29C|nr:MULTISPECIES: NAD-dependent epimerase/dehydratase family protein [Oxalobacteraceae]
MKVLIFGATGMVGQGVLRECLLDPEVTQVLSLGRRPTGIQHPKLREIIHTDLYDYSNIESELTGVDACFYCLGVSSVGMKEADYARISYDMTLAAAQVLARLNPNMVFTYVSGAGTDSTEKGAVMWARVKGKTENALLRLPLRAYMFRPGIIQPLHGVRSKTRLYQFFYTLAAPLFPIFRAIFPHQITTTEQVGKAMLIVARRGSDKKLLESKDIVTLR